MRSTTQKGILLGLMAIVLVFAWNGCAFLGKEPVEPRITEREQAPPEETKPTRPVDTGPPIKEEFRSSKKSTGLVHRVQWQGETLAIIAKWYTGRLKNWQALAKANPKLRPNRILIGNKIHIPEDLLNTRKPMPKEFLAAFTSKPKKKRSVSRPKTPPEEETEPVLFGPKEYPK